MNLGSLYPELTLGSAPASRSRRLKLQRFLASVVRQRGCALHLANLWNALYFRYDLAAKGFNVQAIDAKRVPVREAKKRDFSLPVGGFVRVHTEAAHGDLLAEVIYKEGAHPDLDGGHIDPALSGAPATTIDEFSGQTVAVVNERFVLDLGAFGPTANDLTTQQYRRLVGRGRWLDRWGHLLIEAVYPPERAALEDVSYYIEDLMVNHREGLLAYCFREEPSDEDLREALLNSFASVRDLALGATDLKNWRGKYFFSAAEYRGRIADLDAILGGSDQQTLYRGLTRVPSGSSRCYAAVGPRIIDHLKQGGLDADEEALVRGSAYATAVAYTNVFVAEKLAVEQESGVLEGGAHLRLDDDWQAGGIWRAERVTDPDHYSLGKVPATLPLGLGYAESVGPALADEDIPEAVPDLAASQTSFTVSLTNRDRALGRLRLPPGAAAQLAPGQIDVYLRHDGEPVRTPVEREGTFLYGIAWPWTCHFGIVLLCNLERGMSVVKVRTEAVAPPISIDGVELRFKTDEAVYRHEHGLEELSDSEKRGAATLSELINRAFRTRGRHRSDGRLALSLAEIVTVVLGPAWSRVESRVVAEALGEMGLERDGADYVWRPRLTQRTRVTDKSLLEAYSEARPDRNLPRIVQQHWVGMHLRRLVKRRPDPRHVAEYTDARRRYGWHGILPEALPPDYTWVKAHERGSDGSNDVDVRRAAVLDEATPDAPFGFYDAPCVDCGSRIPRTGRQGRPPTRCSGCRAS